jgi:hypothetical protein
MDDLFMLASLIGVGLIGMAVGLLLAWWLFP